MTQSIALLRHGVKRSEEEINVASSRLTYHLLRGTKDSPRFEPGTLNAECEEMSRKLHVFGANYGKIHILVEL
jgi:hypothetical protein